MVDIARQINRTSRGREELQRLAAGCVENDAKTAFVVPTGKPLSIFDAAVLPAAYTVFIWRLRAFPQRTNTSVAPAFYRCVA